MRPAQLGCSFLEATKAATAVQTRLQYCARNAHSMSTGSNAKMTPAIEAHLLRMQQRHAALLTQLTGVTRTTLAQLVFVGRGHTIVCASRHESCTSVQ